MKKSEFFTTCLRDCYDTCLIKTNVKKGEIEEIEGAKEHPITSGFLCPKGNKLKKWVYHPQRIKKPMVGKSFSWREASWEEAFSEILKAVEKNPDKVGFYSYYGNSGVISKNYPERFFRKLNSYAFKSAICDRNGRTAIDAMNADFLNILPEEIQNFKQVIIWGANPKWTALHNWYLILKAGLTRVVIDPIKTVTFKDSHYTYRPDPSTDWHLAYGLLKYILENELYDKEEVKKRVKGFSRIKSWVIKNISLDDVSEKTRISREKIEKLARRIAKVKPGYFYIGYGLQRQRNGGEIVRAIVTLAAVSGYKIFYSREDYVPQAKEYVKGVNLGELKYLNQLELAKAIEEDKIKVLFVFNSNPITTSPNSNRLKNAFLRDDVTVIVHDLFFTDTVKMADIILPAASFFEHFDVATSYFHDYININEKVIDPLYDSKSNYSYFRELSKFFGFKEEEFDETEEEIAQKFLNYYGFTLEELREKGFLKMKRPETKEKRIVVYGKELKEKGLSDFPYFIEDSPGEGWFRIISPSHRDLISSQYYKVTTEFYPARLYMNEADANDYSIRSGDKVKLSNELGEAVIPAEIRKEVPRGVLMLYKAPWESIAGYNSNIFTSDEPHPVYGGSQFHSAFVRIEKVSDQSE